MSIPAQRIHVWQAVLLCALACGVAGCGGGHHNAATATTGSTTTTKRGQAIPPGIHQIRHVVVIMQENRSFDSYFGTYPGADGLPAKNGQFTVCLPDPASGGCDRPFYDPSPINGGGPHTAGSARADLDGGRMDGFVRLSEQPGGRGCGGLSGVCASGTRSDVMGYHDAREIPNYWKYAAELRSQRPHVPIRPLVEPAVAPVHGLRVVGTLLASGRPVELRQRRRARWLPDGADRGSRRDRTSCGRQDEASAARLGAGPVQVFVRASRGRVAGKSGRGSGLPWSARDRPVPGAGSARVRAAARASRPRDLDHATTTRGLTSLISCTSRG